MNTIKEDIDKLADLLDWEKYHKYRRVPCLHVKVPNGSGQFYYFRADPEWCASKDILALACVLEAEMAKRGWKASLSTMTDTPTFCFVEVCGKRMRRIPNATMPCSYHPSDPISKAHAIIKSTIKALEDEQ